VPPAKEQVRARPEPIGQLYAGTSGFSYSGWRGVFYPEKLAGSRMLEFYAERLNGVELNGSFYRTPPAATLSGWLDRTPPSFRFCLKAHRGLTYSADAFDRVGLARNIAPNLSGLGERLGPLLLQFPPARKRDPGLLDALLEALGLRAAAEFRDESWFAPDVYGVLERRGAALVVTDEEKWPRAPVKRLARFAYYRLRRDYTPAELDDWGRRLEGELRHHDELHAYFKHEPEAPARAGRLLGRRLSS